jgi:hypothetical protein
MTGPLTVGPAVILTGETLGVARQALLVAQLSRRRNGLPESAPYTDLLAAIGAALSATGQTDTVLPAELSCSATELNPDDLSTEEAATMLNCTPRQARRLAPKLGGRKIGGRWLLDRHAIAEHLAGAA